MTSQVLLATLDIQWPTGAALLILSSLRAVLVAVRSEVVQTAAR